VNASAPALTRVGEVQSKIRKVSTFSRLARVVCAALFGFGLVGSVVVLIFGALGAIFPPVPSGGVGFTLAQKAWMLPIAGATFGVGLAIARRRSHDLKGASACRS
jgi:hypothetical protein